MARYGRSSGGFKARLAIAALIAVISLVSYFSTSQRNPVTGRVQRVALSPSQEVELGLQAVPAMMRQHQGLHPDGEAQKLVDDVGNELMVALDRWMQRGGGENPYRFEFHLLRESETINAFALPGGQVFITDALFSKLDTRGQLVSVLGHEVGHVLSRHAAQRLAKQKLTHGLVGAAGVAGGDVNSARLAHAIGQMVNMKYGREDELESDRWGVVLAVEAGYDPRAMIGVMKILEQAGGGSQPEIMSTHPKPANRIEYLREVIESVYPDGLPDGLRP